VLSNLVSRTIAQLYSERFGISIPEWRVMAVLARSAPLTQNQITERTAMDKVRVSRAVARLVARRFVERRPDKRDRRQTLLRLSRRGRGIYRKIVPLARDAEAQLLSALSPAERDEIDRLLKKLESRVAAQM
jgi:DNA-binding MarR family transcriptional regulator